jgi:hypothetical protein
MPYVEVRDEMGRCRQITTSDLALLGRWLLEAIAESGSGDVRMPDTVVRIRPYWTRADPNRPDWPPAADHEFWGQLRPAEKPSDQVRQLIELLGKYIEEEEYIEREGRR